MFGKSGVSLGGKSPSDAAGKAQDLMGQPTFAHDDYLSLLLVKCGEDLSEIKNDVMHSAELLAKQSKVAERAAHVVMRSFSTAVKVYRERVERENEEKERIKRVIYAEAVKPWQNVALDCAAPLSPQQKQTGQERVGAVSGAGGGGGAPSVATCHAALQREGFGHLVACQRRAHAKGHVVIFPLEGKA
jgi:hypothetical protein